MNQCQSALTRRPRQHTANPSAVLGMFEAQVRHDPGGIAVTCGGATLGYGELERRADQVANHLLGIGVQPGDRVALCMTRSLELIVAMLGAVKTCAAYLRMDLAYPWERLAYMLADAE